MNKGKQIDPLALETDESYLTLRDEMFANPIIKCENRAPVLYSDFCLSEDRKVGLQDEDKIQSSVFHK